MSNPGDGASAVVAGRLTVGAEAPAFTLDDEAGAPVSLSDFGGRPVLVYFYPKADSAACTTQACGLRDILGDIGDTAVVGISPDPPDKQARFAQRYGLGFPLLCDADHLVAEAYGVWVRRSINGRPFMGVERAAFLVDGDRTLRDVWYRVSPKDTPKLVLKSVTGS